MGGFSTNTYSRIVNSEANGWLGLIVGPLEYLENAIKTIKDIANKANKNPNNFKGILLTWPNIVDSKNHSTNAGQRFPLTGTIDQAGNDIQRIKQMGIDHIIFDSGIPIFDSFPVWDTSILLETFTYVYVRSHRGNLPPSTYSASLIPVVIMASTSNALFLSIACITMGSIPGNFGFSKMSQLNIPFFTWVFATWEYCKSSSTPLPKNSCLYRITL
jgi:hypothetical protein